MIQKNMHNMYCIYIFYFFLKGLITIIDPTCDCRKYVLGKPAVLFSSVKYVTNILHLETYFYVT